MRKPYWGVLVGVWLGGLSGPAVASVLGSWPPGINHHSTAVAVTGVQPPGCLSADQGMIYTFKVRLGGIEESAYPKESPPVEAESFIYFYLDKPVSVCGEPQYQVPAYIHVNRLAFGPRSNGYYRYLVKYWGQWEVRVTGSLLHTVSGIYGPIGMYDVKRICFRGGHHGKVGSLWWCMSGKTWGHLYQPSKQWLDELYPWALPTAHKSVPGI